MISNPWDLDYAFTGRFKSWSLCVFQNFTAVRQLSRRSTNYHMWCRLGINFARFGEKMFYVWYKYHLEVCVWLLSEPVFTRIVTKWVIRHLGLSFSHYWSFREISKRWNKGLCFIHGSEISHVPRQHCSRNSHKIWNPQIILTLRDQGVTRLTA